MFVQTVTYAEHMALILIVLDTSVMNNGNIRLSQ